MKLPEKSERILEKLKELPEGAYLTQLSKSLGMRRSTVFYNIFGWTKEGKFYGGYLKPLIVEAKQEGHNKFVKLRLGWQEIKEGRQACRAV